MQLRKMTYLLMAFTTSLTAIDSFAGGAVNAHLMQINRRFNYKKFVMRRVKITCWIPRFKLTHAKGNVSGKTPIAVN